MFELLTSKISDIFSGLKKKAVISEEDLDKALREIRISLLEADVALPAIKDFLTRVKEVAVGKEIYKSISPSQMIIKIVHDELINLLEAGDKSARLIVNGNPATYMVVGLQGAGKTTSVAKLAHYLKTKLNKKVLITSIDLQRAAAYDQLLNLAHKHNIDFFEHVKSDTPVQIAIKAKQFAQKNAYDILILDTAGRINIDAELMQELTSLNKAVTAQEILLVVDAMIGQIAVKMAADFNAAVELTGSILTKVDGDPRGGAALSIKYVTGVPIKFMGLGESVTSFEIFDSRRIADRILEQGDVVTLVEKVAELNEDEEVKGLTSRLQQGIFTMEDFKKQLGQLKKLGGIGGVMNFIPGLSGIKNKIKEAGIDDNLIKRQVALIDSMTKAERNNPNILNGSRKKRIALGAGGSVQELNKLLKQYEQAAKMLKQFNKGGMQNLMNMMKGRPKLFN